MEGEVFGCEIESNGTRIKLQHQHEVEGGSHSSLSHEMARLPLVWFLLLLRKRSSIGCASHPSLHLVPVKQAPPFP